MSLDMIGAWKTCLLGNACVVGGYVRRAPCLVVWGGCSFSMMCSLRHGNGGGGGGGVCKIVGGFALEPQFAMSYTHTSWLLVPELALVRGAGGDGTIAVVCCSTLVGVATRSLRNTRSVLPYYVMFRFHTTGRSRLRGCLPERVQNSDRVGAPTRGWVDILQHVRVDLSYHRHEKRAVRRDPLRRPSVLARRRAPRRRGVWRGVLDRRGNLHPAPTRGLLIVSGHTTSRAPLFSGVILGSVSLH